MENVTWNQTLTYSPTMNDSGYGGKLQLYHSYES